MVIGRYDLWLVGSVILNPQKSCRNIFDNVVFTFVTSLLRTIATESSNTNVEFFKDVP